MTNSSDLPPITGNLNAREGDELRREIERLKIRTIPRELKEWQNDRRIFWEHEMEIFVRVENTGAEKNELIRMKNAILDRYREKFPKQKGGLSTISRQLNKYKRQHLPKI